MKTKIIGLTYDLRSSYRAMGFSEEETAEFDKEETIEALELAIQQCGYKTRKIGNIYELTQCLAAGERWDLVFNIAEGMSGACRESQVPALLDAYRIPYTFANPLTLAITLDKAYTKMVLKNHGFDMPQFFRISSSHELNGLPVQYPVFVKPVAEGTGKGIGNESIIDSFSALSAQVEKLLEKHQQPVIIEEYLPGREFTAGITGTGKQAQVLGIMEVIPEFSTEPIIYGYHTKENYQSLIHYALVNGPLADEIADLALSSYQILGCEDAGRVDIKLNAAGKPCFIEINPLAGLNPVHSDLPILCKLVGISYLSLIKKILGSAEKKMNPTVNAPV
ncbi:MAG: ATP-grasp domain-containing protein [Bacteroidales bacterium]|nr:ATP-grasp domain-containing protein [Bacteroidales bacterium]